MLGVKPRNMCFLTSPPGDSEACWGLRIPGMEGTVWGMWCEMRLQWARKASSGLGILSCKQWGTTVEFWTREGYDQNCALERTLQLQVGEAGTKRVIGCREKIQACIWKSLWKRICTSFQGGGHGHHYLYERVTLKEYMFTVWPCNRRSQIIVLSYKQENKTLTF